MSVTSLQNQPTGSFRRARSKGRGRSGFTIVEVMMAIAIFGMAVLAIYEIWMAVIKASQAGLSAAAQAQRARVSIKAIEDALTTAQMFSANGKYYYFLADTSDEKSGSLSFVARLPASFPGVGHYGDRIVRRVSFFTDAEGNLFVTQLPMMVAEDKDIEPYRLQLAKDVTLFMFEFWDEQKKEYVNEWAKTNQLPKLVRVALGLGSAGHNSKVPQDLVTRTIAMASTAVRGEWQAGQMMPGVPGAPGMPMPPGAPGVPGQPGVLPGGRPAQPIRPGGR
jgi:prepilin-type N-terminal cleavage/methylation domain-containing protein